MLVRPLPGVMRQFVRDALHAAYLAGHNVYLSSDNGTADLYNAYFAWAHDSARNLRNLISGQDIARLVLTPRYWNLYSVPVASAQPIREAIKFELEQQGTALQEAYGELDFLEQRWGALDRVQESVFMVADTNVFCQHAERFDKADYAADLGIGDRPLHIVIPLVVVDELDRLKDRGQGAAKTNARDTIRLLDKFLPSPGDIGNVRPAGPSPADPGVLRGKVTVELFIDPPEHVRLPRPDDEIIDQAIVLQGLAGRRIRVLIGDIGMSTRSRLRDLHTVRINFPDPPA
ncbi:MAG: hypothetical protein JWL97_3722, partial [Gemmatimonadales bacterium]|nr:hypothetical protein [Gemmatimonadales bacterium]